MDFISINDKIPDSFCKVWMKCDDGIVRFGTYEPERYLYQWIFDFDPAEGNNPHKITHWKLA